MIHVSRFDGLRTHLKTSPDDSTMVIVLHGFEKFTVLMSQWKSMKTRYLRLIIIIAIMDRYLKLCGVIELGGQLLLSDEFAYRS